MEIRARIQTDTPRASILMALGALLALFAGLLLAPADAFGNTRKAPVVTSIAPDRLTVGEQLTVRGRHFRRGKGRNTVVFKRDGARAVFVKADIATTKMLRVKVSRRLEKFLKVEDGTPQYTRFRLRVLSERFGRSFTRAALSPFIGPEKPATPPKPPAPPADGDCDGDGTVNGVDTDDDNDLLPDATEARIKTDACKLDSDGDGAGDGYEFQSALDLNDDEYQEPNNSLPYPQQRPYPNALFADSQLDYDGDGLSLNEEHQLWRDTDATAGLDSLNYSDGLQYSLYVRGSDGRRRGSIMAAGYDRHESFLSWAGTHGYKNVLLPDGSLRDIRDFNRDGSVSSARDLETAVTPEVYYRSELRYYDFDEDGRLSDDERDEDGDGLTNYDESHGRMTPAYWTGCYSKEGPYPVPYAGTSLTDPDSDGDGVLDGADDQDHDDLPNLMEMSRNAAGGRMIVNRCNDKDAIEDPSPRQGRVNPFNPCLPVTDSRSCTRHPDLAAKFAPFAVDFKDYYVLN